MEFSNFPIGSSWLGCDCSVPPPVCCMKNKGNSAQVVFTAEDNWELCSHYIATLHSITSATHQFQWLYSAEMKVISPSVAQINGIFVVIVAPTEVCCSLFEQKYPQFHLIKEHVCTDIRWLPSLLHVPHVNNNWPYKLLLYSLWCSTIRKLQVHQLLFVFFLILNYYISPCMFVDNL